MSKVRGRGGAAANQGDCFHVDGGAYGHKYCFFPIVPCFEFGSNSSVEVRRKVDLTALALIPLAVLSCTTVSWDLLSGLSQQLRLISIQRNGVVDF